MTDYVQEILDAFDKAEPKGSGTKNSATPSNLFKVDEDCEKLKEKEATAFHNLVAKTLCATKRARPDTCTPIAFLTTRVREPATEDWAKMVHMMKCIRGTKMLPLILSANDSGMLKWWIDASFAVHRNMRGHTGGGLSVGRGFPIVSSTKQKLNARSSAETTESVRTLSVKTTRVPFSWRRTAKHQAASVRSMSTSDIILSPIASRKRTSRSNGVPGGT
jgi:hypothetical protein